MRMYVGNRYGGWDKVEVKKRKKYPKIYKQYVVLEDGNYINTWNEEMDSMFLYSSCEKEYFIKNKKLYCKYSYEELDDWYADIGAVTHWESETKCLGKVKYASNNMLTIINNCWLNKAHVTISEPNSQYIMPVNSRLDKNIFKNVTKISVLHKYDNKDVILELTPYYDEYFRRNNWYEKIITDTTT